MSFIKGVPNPEGSPREKFLYPPKAPPTFDALYRELRSENVPEELARQIAQGFTRYADHHLIRDYDLQNQVEYWANRHTHPGGSGPPLPSPFGPPEFTGYVVTNGSNGQFSLFHIEDVDAPTRISFVSAPVTTLLSGYDFVRSHPPRKFALRGRVIMSYDFGNLVYRSALPLPSLESIAGAEISPDGMRALTIQRASPSKLRLWNIENLDAPVLLDEWTYPHTNVYGITYNDGLYYVGLPNRLYSFSIAGDVLTPVTLLGPFGALDGGIARKREDVVFYLSSNRWFTIWDWPDTPSVMESSPSPATGPGQNTMRWGLGGGIWVRNDSAIRYLDVSAGPPVIKAEIPLNQASALLPLGKYLIVCHSTTLRIYDVEDLDNIQAKGVWNSNNANVLPGTVDVAAL